MEWRAFAVVMLTGHAFLLHVSTAACFSGKCDMPGVAHALPAMVFFFLFLFVPLFAAFLLTVHAALCKPGCAVSTADMSSV